MELNGIFPNLPEGEALDKQVLDGSKVTLYFSNGWILRYDHVADRYKNFESNFELIFRDEVITPDMSKPVSFEV